MKNKIYFLRTFSSICVLIILYSILIYFIDPLQQFRNTNYGSGSERLINPGIARNYDYNIAVLGTSTSQNFLKKDVEHAFGKRAINLSLSGSTNYEQRELMKLVVVNPNVETIIYGLDFFSFDKGVTESRVQLQEYLYNKVILSNLKYIFNFETFRIFLKVSKKKLQKKEFDSNWRDKLGYWGDRFTYSEDKALTFDSSTQNGAQNIGIISGLKNGYNKENMDKNLEIFSKIISENPNIKFEIYFPPYASIYWVFADKYGEKDKLLNFKIEAIEHLKKNSNVKIYDFQNAYNITNNLDNYKDIVHYNPKISKKILELIKKENYEVNKEDYSKNLIDFSKQIQVTKERYRNILNKELEFSEVSLH